MAYRFPTKHDTCPSLLRRTFDFHPSRCGERSEEMQPGCGLRYELTRSVFHELAHQIHESNGCNALGHWPRFNAAMDEIGNARL